MGGEDEPPVLSAAINPYDHQPFTDLSSLLNYWSHWSREEKSDKVSRGGVKVKWKSQLRWKFRSRGGKWSGQKEVKGGRHAVDTGSKIDRKINSNRCKPQERMEERNASTARMKGLKNGEWGERMMRVPAGLERQRRETPSGTEGESN